MIISLTGGKNNPPDLILRNGDAEIKNETMNNRYSIEYSF